MNKKAIVVDFLVTILLAIIIFIPTCAIAANFFRLSDQAQDNFTALTKELKQLAKQPSGTRESSLLILDSDTALVYFEPQAAELSLYVQGLGSLDLPGDLSGHYDVVIKKPASCVQDQACLCLFRESETALSYFDHYKEKCFSDRCRLIRISFNAVITSQDSICRQEINLPLQLADCSIGTRHSAIAYHCRGGFIIERELLKNAGFVTYYQAPRRIPLQLTKEDDAIFLAAISYEQKSS